MVSAVLADNPFNGDRKMSNPFAHLTLPRDARVVEVDGRHYLVTQSREILGSRKERTLSAWAPIATLADNRFSTISSHGSGMFWGRLGTEHASAEVHALPAMSDERIDATMAHFAERAAFARRVIFAAFPEVAGGDYSGRGLQAEVVTETVGGAR